jgi:hypothetical protein
MAGTLPGEFQRILDNIGQILLDEVRTEMSAREWSSAFFEIRGAAKSATRISKLRIILPDGKQISQDDPPIEKTPIESILDPMFDHLWKMRDSSFPDKWYGIKVTIHPDGECKVGFNYDSKCATDPTFFDD